MGKLDTITLANVKEAIIKLAILHPNSREKMKILFRYTEKNPWPRYRQAFLNTARPEAEIYRLMPAREMHALLVMPLQLTQLFIGPVYSSEDEIVQRAKSVPIEFGHPLKYLCAVFNLKKACDSLIKRYNKLNRPSAGAILAEVRKAGDIFVDLSTAYTEEYLNKSDPFQLRYRMTERPEVVDELQRLDLNVGRLLSIDSMHDSSPWPALERILRGHVANVRPELKFSLTKGSELMFAVSNAATRNSEAQQRLLKTIGNFLVERPPITENLYTTALSKIELNELLQATSDTLTTIPAEPVAGMLDTGSSRIAGTVSVNKHSPHSDCEKLVLDICPICLETLSTDTLIVRLRNRPAEGKFSGHWSCRICYEQLVQGLVQWIGGYYDCPFCRDHVSL